MMLVEQQALDHRKQSEANAQMHIDRCEQQSRLLHEEIYAKSQGLQISDHHGLQLRQEPALSQAALAQEKATVHFMTQNTSQVRDDAVLVQSKYVESLKEVERWKAEQTEESQMYHE